MRDDTKLLLVSTTPEPLPSHRAPGHPRHSRIIPTRQRRDRRPQPTQRKTLLPIRVRDDFGEILQRLKALQNRRLRELAERLLVDVVVERGEVGVHVLLVEQEPHQGLDLGRQLALRWRRRGLRVWLALLRGRGTCGLIVVGFRILVLFLKPGVFAYKCALASYSPSTPPSEARLKKQIKIALTLLRPRTLPLRELNPRLRLELPVELDHGVRDGPGPLHLRGAGLADAAPAGEEGGLGLSGGGGCVQDELEDVESGEVR